MAWIERRNSSPAKTVQETISFHPVHPALQQMLAELPEKPYFRLDEVAAHFDISVDLVEEWISTGKLSAVRLSPRNRRIPRGSLCNYILKYVQPG